jgi:hypothetical protein
MKRSFFFLAAVTLAALLVLLVFTPGDGAPDKHGKNALLLPGATGWINNVNRVEIIAAGSRPVATLLKTGDGWQIEQMDGYRADWPKLQSLLAALATTLVVEAKTDKPEHYARLGVEDITPQDADSVLVQLSTDESTSGILIGHQAQGRQGQYVRLQGARASALVDKELDVSTTTMDWVESRIIDINASEVAEVEMIRPDGERVFVTRISADQTDFDLVGLPVEREIKSSWAVNSLGSVLSMLNMETVRADDIVDWSTAIRIRLLTFSGMEIMADALQLEDEYLFRLKASHPAASIVREDSEENVDGDEQAIEKQAADDVEKRVNDINQQAVGWIYAISSQKFEAMSKKPEDLLKPLAST